VFIAEDRSPDLHALLVTLAVIHSDHSLSLPYEAVLSTEEIAHSLSERVGLLYIRKMSSC
jgi:hypothetical protein